ncbi:MAG: hypothetical protein Q8P12_02640 [bacterium]|nr:hypothetical protein [bacterium]MDZ4345151.1 hypothetical protein [Candidatus Binatia bacterium]
MKQAREALRMMPLGFLRQALKHYSVEEQWEEGCLFCQKYLGRSSCLENRCESCPFSKVLPAYFHFPSGVACGPFLSAACNNLVYGGRKRIKAYNGIQWWRGFLCDVRAVIKEKEAK